MSEDEYFRALQEGSSLLGLGRPHEAIAAFTRATTADPQGSGAHAGLAIALLALEKPHEAMLAAQRALALEPWNDTAQRVLATAQLKLGATGDSEREAKRAVQISPESYASYVTLSQSLLGSGDLAGALHAANYAVQLAPNLTVTHSAVSLVKLKHEDYVGAEAAARAALAIDPQDQTALNNLAVAMTRQHRRGEAAETLDHAMRVSPGHAVVRRNVMSMRHSPTARANFTEPTRQLIADDARARRYQPQRWNYRRMTRLRPWWWRRVSPPWALVINAGLLTLFLRAALRGDDFDWVLVAGGGMLLPVSFLRLFDWWRVRHPPASSWRPPIDPGGRPGG